MSIYILLAQGKEIRFEIRKKFQSLTLEEKLKLVLSMQFAYVLSDSLSNNSYIPPKFDTEFLEKAIPYAERHKRYDLLFFATEILNNYTELHPEFDVLNTTELANVISKDKDFLENNPTMQVFTYMLENTIGSFCYDW